MTNPIELRESTLFKRARGWVVENENRDYGYVGKVRTFSRVRRQLEFEQRARVPYNVVYVDDGERPSVASCTVPLFPIVATVRRRFRPTLHDGGPVHEARAAVTLRPGAPYVAAVHVRVPKRILDVDLLKGQRLLFGFPPEQFALAVRRRRDDVLPAPVPFPRLVKAAAGLRRGRLHRQHARRFEIVRAREHHTPADRVNLKRRWVKDRFLRVR